MQSATRIEPRRLRLYTGRDIDQMPGLSAQAAEQRLAMQAVAAVLPFKVNQYVLEELIDWSKVPDDPIYQMTIPQPGMLEPAALEQMMGLIRRGGSREEKNRLARQIQETMNPHPAGQVELNVPRLGDIALPGMQHKYRETVLFFPIQGQTCHTYCTYCFRWAQFVGIDELKFASRQGDLLGQYLREHREVSSVLFTGGDPMVMNTRVLRTYIEPLLRSGFEHLSSIRIGTKAPAYWPFRFITDPDADDLLALFREVRGAGKNLALMAHYSHPRELETPAAQVAVQRILDTGAVIRCQAPLVRHVNDSPETWADLWRMEVMLGAVPYYMFVERDTGPKRYFEVPLARALDIFQQAYTSVSGLARTVRGPSMSATPGKVLVDGVAEIEGRRVFVLKMLQGRDPAWVNKVFFAEYDENATWLDELRPAFGEAEFFFAPEVRNIRTEGAQRAWAQHALPRRPLVHFGHVEWE